MVRMSFSQESPISAVEMMRFGRPSWLPPFGHGNGLDALFWACIAELPHTAIDGILDALREQDIPGWAAPVKTAAKARHRGTDTCAETNTEPFRLWVATLRFNDAENVLITVLNNNPQPRNGPTP
ncbi:hypothetical protein [Arthrobacter sp. STN4]|uniref:hypothetical protein n=1 Tax=Arthrobacter sp. STN4 TaxID=2923276 RepID=UPI00211A2680|nr:hypothetical protein [Arthrobacter sp. STN4]MCQ9163940.1 hypothetical protein [Arthrobacter sp. STN4]